MTIRRKTYATTTSLRIAGLVLLLSAVALLDSSRISFYCCTPENAYGQGKNQLRYFPETGYTVRGRFLEYWEKNGGLPQQGYPISEEFSEVSDVNGKAYTVQYFERAVFEHHPENKPPYDVLLTLLGTLTYREKYPGPQGAPSQKPNTSEGSIYFPQTGKRLGGSFLLYWRAFGGLIQQGYPISDEIQERSPLDGKIYTMQYFERAVMEWHPGNTPPADILLSHLGRFRLEARYKMLPPTPRLISSDIFYLEGSSSGPYLFYGRFRTDGGTIDTKNIPLYGYNLIRNEEFLISDRPGEKFNVASDGKIVVWTELRGKYKFLDVGTVYAYDLATGKQSVLLETNVSHYPGAHELALDGGVLYYVDRTEEHNGLYARELATGNEKLIAPSRDDPPSGTKIILGHVEAVEGIVAWKTTVMVPTGAVIANLYMLKVSSVDGSATGSVEPTLIFSTQDYDLSDYRMSGDGLVWDVYPRAGAARNIYFYRLSGENANKTEIIHTNGLNPFIKGHTIVWTDRSSPRQLRLLAYDTRTQSTSTVVEGGVTRALIRYGGQTVLTYSTATPSGGSELYIMGLGQK